MIIDNKSPIIGIGNDIIAIERIRKSINAHGPRLLSKLFSVGEQEYCLKRKDSVPCFAGKFSAKEAVVKALGTGFGAHIGWLDIEILNDSKGKPYVNFSEQMQQKIEGTEVLISISHCEHYAATFALWIRSPN